MMIKNTLLFSKIFRKKQPNTLPDDIYLVSYPKSGNTWLRFILANLLNKKEQINFTNIHQYSPEEGKTLTLKECANKPRFIKSHSIFSPSFPKIIYIARDGRDVYVSYYHYLKSSLPPDTSFKDFLNNGPFRYGRWSDHITSWLDNCNQPFLVIKYEDMQTAPLITMRKIVNFMGIEEDDPNIETALEKSSFKKMQTLEKKFGRGTQKTGPEVFMRKGKTGNWREYFYDEEKEIFKKKDALSLTRLQYEDTNNW